jgi:hypothetical protein
MTATTAQTSDAPKGVPNWLSALIILLFISAGLWGIWQYFEGGVAVSATDVARLNDANVVGPALPRAPRGQGPRMGNGGGLAALFSGAMPDGIGTMPGNNGYFVKAVNVRLVAAGNGDNWRYRFNYIADNLIPPDQRQILWLGRRAANDPNPSALGVTPQQLQQLRALPFAGMVVEPADRTQIAAMFQAWLVASGQGTARATTAPVNRPVIPGSLSTTPDAKAAEQKLVAALIDLGKRQLGATRQAEIQHVQQVRSILGGQLLQKLKSM